MNMAQWVLCTSLHIYAHVCVCVSAQLWLTVTRWLFTQCIFSTLCINTIKKAASKINWQQNLKSLNRLHIFSITTPFSLHKEAGLGHSDILTSGKRVWNGNSVNAKFIFLFYNNKTLSVRAMQSSSCAGRSAVPPMMLGVATAATVLPVTDLGEFFCRHPLMILRIYPCCATQSSKLVQTRYKLFSHISTKSCKQNPCWEM